MDEDDPIDDHEYVIMLDEVFTRTPQLLRNRWSTRTLHSNWQVCVPSMPRLFDSKMWSKL
jgi:hypothetical protein